MYFLHKSPFLRTKKNILILYTKHSFDTQLAETTTPEIQRCNLASVILLMKSLGINDLIKFDYMDPPPAESIVKSCELLYALGALNTKGELTKVGRMMAEFPLIPQLSKCIIESTKYKCTNEILILSSILSCNQIIYFKPKDKMKLADTCHKNFTKPGGDLFTLLYIYNQWIEVHNKKLFCQDNFLNWRAFNRTKDIYEQLENICLRVEIDSELSNNSLENIGKCMISGYFMNISRLDNSGKYKLIKNNRYTLIHPSSSLNNKSIKWILFIYLILTTEEFMRECIQIKPKWLLLVAPHYIRYL